MGSVRLAVRSKAWIPSQEEWLLAAQAIQPEEKQRIGRFVFKREAKSSMIGRLLMRKVVSEMLQIPWREVKLSRTEKGKPVVDNPLPPELASFSFNISHQGELVVLAAERNCCVGVDVMNTESPRMKSVNKFFDTMKRQLTENEWGQVSEQPTESEQLQTFYRLWCLKESIVKAWGTGIGFEVSRLDFHMPTSELSPSHITMDTSLQVDGKLVSDWIFEETMIDDHCVAVAVQQLGTMSSERGCGHQYSPPLFHFLTPAELLSSAQPLEGSLPDLDYWTAFDAKEEQPGRPSSKLPS